MCDHCSNEFQLENGFPKISDRILNENKFSFNLYYFIEGNSIIDLYDLLKTTIIFKKGQWWKSAKEQNV